MSKFLATENLLAARPMHRVLELRAVPNFVLRLAAGALTLLESQLLEAVQAPTLLEQGAHLLPRQVAQVCLAAGLLGIGPEVLGVVLGRFLGAVGCSLAGALALALVHVRDLVVFLLEVHGGGSK